MLERINDIDWSKLSHAYGEASDVPNLIRAIAYGNKGERDTAYQALYGNIWHQGTVYEATAYAVPFFIEMLDNPDITDKDQIVSMLSYLSGGYSSKNYAKLAYEAMVEGYEVYIFLLNTGDSKTQIEAAWLLAECAAYKSTIEPILQQKVRTEPHKHVAQECLKALVSLWHSNGLESSKDHMLTSSQRRYLNDFINSGVLELTYSAALSLARYSTNNEYKQALDVLTQIIESENDYQSLLVNPYDKKNGLLTEITMYIEQEPELAFQWLLSQSLHPHDGTRQSIAMELDSYCRKWRWAIEAVLPIFQRLLADDNDGVRVTVSASFSRFYPFSIPYTANLEVTLNDRNQGIRIWSERALETIKRRGEYYKIEWLLQPQKIVGQPSIDELISALTHSLNQFNRHAHNQALNDILIHLASFGKQAKVAVPVLQQLLDKSTLWTHVYAARALWSIDKSQGELVYQELIAELQPSIISLLIVDCLGEMGIIAEPALNKLKEIAYSEKRFMDYNTDIAYDEEIQRLAKEAIVKIESALSDAQL